MKKTLIYISIIIISVKIVTAQDTLLLNIDQCRKMAIENSEEIKIANATLEKVEGEKTAARSAWLPNVSASATGLYSKKDIHYDLYMPTAVPNLVTGELDPNVLINPATGTPVIGSDGNPVFNEYAYMPIDITFLGGAIAGISAEQPLYAGGKIITGNKMASIGEDMAANNIALTKNDIAYKTDQAYYLYLSVKAKVQLAKKYQKLLAELVTVVRNSFETGMTNQNELLKVQVKYNEASLQVQKAETGLALAQMSLCRLIGADLNTKLKIEDSIDVHTIDVSSVKNAAASDRVEFKLLERKTDLAEQNIKMVRSDYLPTVGVSVGYNYSMLVFDGIDNYDSQGMTALGSIKIPITTFGERKGKISAAKADYKIKQLELIQAEKLLQLEIEQARLYFYDAQTRVSMADEALKQASENMRICQDNYELGMETIVNLLEAKAEWQNAYSNKIDALTELKIKETNLQRVTNTMNF